MQFDIYGRWELPRQNGIIDSSNEAKKAFWQQIDQDTEGLSSACGCYVFALQNIPWYVGLAAKQSFAQECFQHHKINLYNQALRKYERAMPYLYFVAKQTPSGSFASPSKSGHADVGFLENMLIGIAVRRNDQLMNIRGTKLLREMSVPGIINTRQGRARSSVQELRRILNT
jgi:hypothetical protein